ncbi:hypothetical protein IJ103_04235 [Candidatus Saccharibacteria bacterium]|nr:hypothetical protein [Candidatus Saccharibacteria bacterium]
MLYSKVVLSQDELSQLYRERLMMDDSGRIVFGQPRLFTEFLGALSIGSSKVISKGEKFIVTLNFPGHLPVREPVENWYQVAMKTPETLISDPINCRARYKGFLPGFLSKYPKGEGRYSVFYLEDEPRFAECNYILFIYDRADYGDFVDAVDSLLESVLRTRGNSIYRDTFGNSLMVSDELTDQPMLLVPMSLVIGGKEYICEAWDKVLGLR